jgi:hypothetical protein
MAEARAATPAFERYAEAHGLHAYVDWGVPEATQLLRQGFMNQVPNAATGELAGGAGAGWLGHFMFSAQTSGGIEHRMFTVVVAHVPESIGFAARVLCHDRGLDELTTSNPDADADVVELEDRAVTLESERFLQRYRLSTDHDQDQLRVWQLFSPAMIHWLNAEAPSDFSFELQEGALCCFVPGAAATDEELDALSAAAGRVRARVVELAEGAPSTAAVGATRDGLIDAELERHPFERPPRSTWFAARRFGWWGMLTGRSWRLGTEAFFRAYVETIGFERITEAAYRAGHFDTPVPGELTQVAAGRLEGIDSRAHLLFTKDEGSSLTGWTVVVLDRPLHSNTFAFAGSPEEEEAKAKGVDITGTGDANIVWRHDVVRKRDAETLDDFLATARKLLAATIVAGEPKP